MPQPTTYTTPAYSFQPSAGGGAVQVAAAAAPAKQVIANLSPSEPTATVN